MTAQRPTSPWHLTPAHTDDYQQLVELWEAAVRATHHFLPETDLQQIKPRLAAEFFPAVNLVIARNDQQRIVGFLGVAHTKIEMLFVAPDCQSQGVGRLLLRHAVESCSADSVDVNEQNPQAVGFYQHLGFVIEGRSPLDGQGRPYPLLHLRLARAV